MRQQSALIILICFLSVVLCNGNSRIFSDDQLIDTSITQELREIRNKIWDFETYRYILTNITLKNKKQKKNVIQFNFKRPDKIRLEWLEPRKLRGQLAVYNDGVMKAAPSWLPFVVELNPDSKLGMGDANYPIYRASIGHLMDQILADIPRAMRIEVIEQTTAYKIIEIVNDTNRALIKIDKTTGIPAYIEQYDLKGVLIDGGYFDKFEPNIEFPEDFFNL